MVSYSSWYDPPPSWTTGQPPSGFEGVTMNRNIPDTGLHGMSSIVITSCNWAPFEALMLEAMTTVDYPTGMGSWEGGPPLAAGIYHQIGTGGDIGIDCFQLLLQWNLTFVPTWHPRGPQVTQPPDAIGLEWLEPTKIVSELEINGAWRTNLTDNNAWGTPGGQPCYPPREMSCGGFCAGVTFDSYEFNPPIDSFLQITGTPGYEVFQTIEKLNRRPLIDTMGPYHYLEFSPLSVPPFQLLNGVVPMDPRGIAAVVIGPDLMLTATPAYFSQGGNIQVGDVSYVGQDGGQATGMPHLAFTVQESAYRWVFDTAGRRYPLRQVQRRF